MNVEIETIASSLGVGCVRSKLLCPSCKGGQSGEKSFAVGRQGDRIWWKCFRAKCGMSGVSGSHRLPVVPTKELDRLRPYDRPLLPANVKDQTYFDKRFDLNYITTTINIQITEDDRYALPYFDYLGNKRGYVIRQPWWKGTPRPVRDGHGPLYKSEFRPNTSPRKIACAKSLTYPHSTDPVAGWYRGSWGNAHKGVVVVEDQISAMRIAQAGPTAYALLGASLNAEKVRDLYMKHPHVIIIALDPDAQGTAQQMRLKWGGYFNKCRIVALPQDPKDVPYETLLEELGV